MKASWLPSALLAAALPWTSGVAQTTPAAQTISFPPITGFQSVGGTVTLSATASSGLPVTFSTTSTGICAVNGNTASFSGAGTCIITAAQAGNTSYAPVTVSQSFAVAVRGLSFYDIETFAGNGTFGSGGDGGPATDAQLFYPVGVAVDGNGNLYIADIDGNRVRQVTPGGTINTIAGNGTYGFSGDGGLAINAELAGPTSVAVDTSGNVYIADSGNNRIRMVNAITGNISTITGDGTFSFSGDGGPATSAELASPLGVAVDGSGNVYIADTYNYRIRLISASTGNISTIAGNGSYSFSGDGGPATSAALSSPNGVAVDGSGNVYFADTFNQRIRMVSAATGNISTIAGNGIAGFSGDGAPATSAALAYPGGVAVDSGGSVYIADTQNNLIRVVTPDGIISSIAGNLTQSFGGDGGPATSAGLYGPTGVAVDGSGNVYIADVSNDRIRELLPVLLQSITVTPASATIAPAGTAQFAAIGSYSDGTAQAVTSTLTWNSGTTATATINGAGLATGVALGTTQITASSNGVTSPPALLTVTVGQTPQSIMFTPPSVAAVGSPLVLMATASSGLPVNLSSVTPSVCTLSRGNAPATANFLAVGTCMILASQPGDPVTYAPAPAVIGTITVGIGTQTISFPPVTGFQSVGGTVTLGATASSGLPVMFSTSSSGVCTISGTTVSLIGAGTCTITAAQAGNSNYTPATVSQSFTVAGGALSYFDIQTVAGNGALGYSGDGGAATSAAISYATGVAVDRSGNFYIADNVNNRIRKVTPSGTIRTIAGNGTAGFSGDGGPAITAELAYPTGVALDASGNVYIADSANQRIRMVSAATGNINTIAGNGVEGYSGDGGPATSAQLNEPGGLAVDSAGNVYIADTDNNLIRVVSAATGNITTMAGNGTLGYSGDGGPATGAQLTFPLGVAVDAGGNVYIADTFNYAIRMVSAATGNISTIAGNGTPGFSGDGGAATSAELNWLSGLAVDSGGNLYIADQGNSLIRMVTSGGIISTIAGNGTPGFSGDNGAATSAELNYPTSVAVDGSGNVYVADYDNNRIRELLPVALQATKKIGSSAAYLGANTTTEGTWTGTFGSDGNVMADETPAPPSYASVGLTGDFTYTWSTNTTDPRALQTSSGTRVAAQYFSTTSFNIYVNLTDGNTHQVALYLLDFDNASRSETITIKDALTNAVLDTESYSNFQNGVWAVWNIQGSVVIQVTTTGGPNATISGIFFGPVTPKSSAAYVATNTTTEGTWTGTFGADGNVIAGETPAAPSYASVGLTGDYTYTWYANTTDLRALQTSSGATTRVAAQYFSTTSFDINVNLTDGNAHQVALYLLDFDKASRAETITIKDALTNAILDTETYADFQSGVWAVWNIQGSVVFQVTTTGGPNATISGIFFGPPTATSSATNAQSGR